MILDPVHRWHCPACDQRDETRNAGPHTQFHNCPANGGLGIPMVEVRNHYSDADARHQFRGDGIEGAAMDTEHGSGRVDCTVFPIPARMILRSQ